MAKDKKEKESRFPLMEQAMAQLAYDKQQEQERQVAYEASEQGFYDKVGQHFSDIFGILMVDRAFDMCGLLAAWDAVGCDHEETPYQVALRLGLDRGFEPREAVEV